MVILNRERRAGGLGVTRGGGGVGGVGGWILCHKHIAVTEVMYVIVHARVLRNRGIKLLNEKFIM